MQLDLIAFDLNGTLLDMSALDPHFVRTFGTATMRDPWFEQVRALWMAANATGNYLPFDKLAKQAFEQLAADAGRNIAPRDEAALLAQMTQLPPFADVREGLTQLRKRGKPLVALTNGTLKAARAQLDYAGIKHLFDAVFSADEVGRYKPAPEAYLQVLEKLDVEPREAMLVSAHDWDLTGARAVGLETAFLSRPGVTVRPPQEAAPQRNIDALPALAPMLEKLKG